MDGNNERADRRVHVKASRKALSAVLAASMALSAPGLPAFADVRPDGGYDDVSQGAWYYDSVMDATHKGLMSGYGGTYLFGPENELLRAEMAQLLANASDEETVPDAVDTTGLADLIQPAWYTSCINWAYAQGLIKGYDLPGDDLFGPNDPLTREQAMVVLMRWAEARGADVNAYNDVAEDFPDWDDVSDWARKAVEWAVERDLVDGTEGWDATTLDPQRPVLRSEMAKMIANAEDVIGNGWLNIDTDGDGKPDLNIDTDGDGKPDLNIDVDHDGVPDLNIDVDDDGKADVNIDVDGDGVPDLNIDVDGDLVPDLNVDTDGDGKPDLNIDTDGDGEADLNMDTDGDGKPDLNVDVDGDGKPDLNIDTDGDGEPDKNIDADGDGKVDYTPPTPIPNPTAQLTVPPVVYEGVAFDLKCDTTRVRDVEWTFTSPSGATVPVEQVAPEGLGENGGSVTLSEDGKWHISGLVTGDNGKTITVEADVVVYEVGTVDFNMPETAHTDTAVTVTAAAANAGEISWTVTKDGAAISLEEAFSGELGQAGGEVTFLAPGEYSLTATVVDEAGQEVTATHDVKVYPVASISLELPSTTHVDESALAQCALENADGLDVEWTVERTDGSEVAEGDVEGIGTLGNDGGELAFKSPGQYELTATVTDDTGREWSATREITSYAVGSARLEAPATAHTDTPIDVKASFSELAGNDVFWKAKVDGVEMDVADVFSGTLGDEGGTVTPVVTGEIELTVGFVDGGGREYAATSTIKSYPVASLSIDVPATTHVDEVANVGCALSGVEGLGVSWKVTAADGEDASEEDVQGVGALGDEGGQLSFTTPGEYTVTATVVDETGREWSASKTIRSYPVGSASLDLPDYAHTDGTFEVEPAFEQLDGNEVFWKVKVDGVEKGLDEVFEGELGAAGGTVRAKVYGELELTVGFVDGGGREYTAVDSMRVYPVPQVDFDMPADAWTDQEISVTPTVKDLGGSHIEWLVDNEYGYQDWDTYVDGELGDEGGTIRFKRAGTFEVVARVVDETGRTFIFEPGDKTVVQPVLGLAFDLPSETYVGDLIELRTYGEVGYLPVQWSLKKDGQPVVDMALYISGSLNYLGGDVSFLEPGVYELTGVMTDVLGREFSWTDTTTVHPNVSYDITVDGSDGSGEDGNAKVVKHLGDDFAIAVDAKNVDGATVEWDVESPDGTDLEWGDLVEGEPGIEGGTVSMKGEPGDYVLVAAVTDAYGKTTEWRIPVTSVNEAPSVPSAVPSVDLDDVKAAFTPSATVRGTVATSASDAHGDAVSYEFDQTLDVKSADNYYGLGEHKGRVRAVDEWGAASEWKDFSIVVELAEPQEPATSFEADFADVEGKFTTSATVRVDLEATGAEASDESARFYQTVLDEPASKRVGLGPFHVTATTTDLFGRTASANDQHQVDFDEPKAPVVTPTLDYSDMTGEFSSEAAVKATFAAALDGQDASLYKAEMTTADGYFKLGQHTANAIVTDAFGRTVEGSASFEVANDAPAAPSITPVVDYANAQGAYTASAKAFVKAGAVAGADRDKTVVEFAPESVVGNEGGYLAKGSHTVKARTVDSFGAASDWTAVTVNLGVVGQADPAGAVYATPTAALSSSTLGSGDVTASSSVQFTLDGTAAVPATYKALDYYNADASRQQGASALSFTASYSSGRHLTVGQVKDFWGSAAYDSKFFVVGSTTAGGGADIATQTTSIAEAGVFDGSTALAYIDSFTFDIPSISGHSSGDSDWVEVYGTKLDGSEVKLVHFNSNSGEAHIDASGGTARWTSDGSPTSGSFSYPAGMYVKLRFVYYNDHPGCLDKATQGLSYTVGYTFRTDADLEENFDNMFDW